MNFRDTQGQDVVLERPAGWKRHKRALFLAVGVALACGSLVALLMRFAAASSSVSLSRLEIASVQQGLFVRDIAADGRVVAAVSPTLYAAASGTIHYRAQAGDAVEKGDVLGVLDSPELASRLAQEQATGQSLELTYKNARLEAQKHRLAARQKLDDARIDLKAAQTSTGIPGPSNWARYPKSTSCVHGTPWTRRASRSATLNRIRDWMTR